METIAKIAKVWYLENTNINSSYITNEQFTVELQKSPTIEAYLDVYNKVGRLWGWSSRLVIKDNELLDILQDSRNEIYYCYYDEEIAAYFELDTHNTDIEIVYFGLVQKFMGLGLGRQLMQKVYQRALKLGITRIWLHTCEFDSPQAMPFYKKMGFELYEEKVEEQICVVDY